MTRRQSRILSLGVALVVIATALDVIAADVNGVVLAWVFVLAGCGLIVRIGESTR